MLSVDRDALLCDLAETYHIYDMRELPVKTLAALSFGLREDSRIKLKMAGMTYIPPMFLLASICDNITMLRYNLLAQEGDKLPTLFTDRILGKVKEDDTVGYQSAEELQAALDSYIKKDGD